MEIDDTFRMNVPVDEAWRILLDLERTVACVPGVEVEETSGDEHRGAFEVTVGAITARYEGMAKIESADEAAHTAILVATGQESDGDGGASVTIELTLFADGDGTRVNVDTDLSVEGRVAQFGHDVLADTSSQLLAQFAENLERNLLSEDSDVLDLTETEAAVADALVEELEAEAETSDELVAEAVAARAEPAAEPSGNGAAVRRVDHDDVESIDLLEAGGTPVLRRLAPVFGLAAAIFLARWLVRRRNR